MKRFLSFIAVLFVCVFTGQIGCGGGGDGGQNLNLGLNDFQGCPFKLSSLLNGPDDFHKNGYWDCTSNGDTMQTSLYEDGSGVSTASDSSVEGFTWTQTGCTSMDITDSSGDFKVFDITYSEPSGIITFKAKAKDEEQSSASCLLYYY